MRVYFPTKQYINIKRECYNILHYLGTSHVDSSRWHSTGYLGNPTEKHYEIVREVFSFHPITLVVGVFVQLRSQQIIN